jgi:hypothetical protein
MQFWSEPNYVVDDFIEMHGALHPQLYINDSARAVVNVGFSIRAVYVSGSALGKHFL